MIDLGLREAGAAQCGRRSRSSHPPRQPQRPEQAAIGSSLRPDAASHPLQQLCSVAGPGKQAAKEPGHILQQVRGEAGHWGRRSRRQRDAPGIPLGQTVERGPCYKMP